MGETRKEKVENEKVEEEEDLSPEKATQLLRLLEALGMSPSLSPPASATPAQHAFWSTQPVPQATAELMNVREDGPIRPERPKEIQKEPVKLPEGLEWCLVDINEEGERSDLYVLLNENYVEDLDAKFRFDYPPNFLEWALKAPGWRQDWHIGVKSSTGGQLVAFISAIPTNFQVRTSQIQAVEVNFLCIHKTIRENRLAPVLIKEVTRRVHLTGTFQALYTAGRLLPEPVGTARYFHRPLNFKRLYEAGFTGIPAGSSVGLMQDRFKVPKSEVKLRKMESKDLPACYDIFTAFMRQFELTPLFSQEEFAHWVLPRERLLYSYVQEDGSGSPSNFITFYSLPSSVLQDDGQPKGHINVAYLFYYGLKDGPAGGLEAMVQSLLSIAKEEGFDVFNALDIMHNGVFLKNLKFALGDGSLHYYLYNWKTSLLPPDKIGVAML